MIHSFLENYSNQNITLFTQLHKKIEESKNHEHETNYFNKETKLIKQEVFSINDVGKIGQL